MAKERILITDDERHIVRLVQVNLTREGYICEVAYDGVECLERLRDPKKEKIDLVVLDVMMPRKDGFTVLKEMMADKELENIPVILLTARASDQDIFSGWASGVSAYLTKPFNPRELLVFTDRILQSVGEEDVADEDVYEV
jgi:two-component system alkaline phosphatase synthesis response regulator PhoP/two-component system response regulator VicR